MEPNQQPNNQTPEPISSDQSTALTDTSHIDQQPPATPTANMPPIPGISPTTQTTETPAAPPEEDEKDFVIAFLLSWLLGYWGADRFYVGKIGTGFLKFITLGGLGIWYTIDLLLIAFGKFRDKRNHQLEGYEKNKRWVKIVALLHLAVFVIIVPLILIALVISTYGGVQSKARDTERKTDINALAAGLDVYYSNNKSVYPTLDDMNSSSFRQSKMPNLPIDALKDPKGTSTVLVSSPTFNSYAYQPTPIGCDNSPKNLCTGYTLTAELENIDNGVTYTKTAP